MSPAHRRLAAWGGAGAACLVLGFAWTGLRGADRNEAIAGAGILHQRYTELYRPGEAPGLAVGQAAEELRAFVTAQQEELASAERSLAPPLAAPYLVETLSEAAAQVTADHSALRQLAARSRTPIPPSLPFEAGLDADPAVRGRQLAQLALLRQAVQTCLHAGVARLVTITVGPAYASAGGDYAVFTAVIDTEADWAATARLIAALGQADGRGLGLRELGLGGGTDQPIKAKMTVSLTTPNRPQWALGAPPAAAAGAATQPADGGRLRRLGGARP